MNTRQLDRFDDFMARQELRWSLCWSWVAGPGGIAIWSS